MAHTRSGVFLSSQIVEAVQPKDSLNSSSVRRSQDANELRERWQSLIDYKLIEWGSNPGCVEDEGVEAPASEIILCAIQLAEQLRDEGLAPPDSVVPDASGGIVFERREHDQSEVFHIWDDLEIEYQRFSGPNMVERLVL